MSRKTSIASSKFSVRNAPSVTSPPREKKPNSESLSSESKKAPWIYTCESQLTCMAVNQSKDRLLAVAGRNLLQIFTVSSDGFQSIHSIKRHQPQGPKQSTAVPAPGVEELQSIIQLTKREPRSFYITTLSWGNSDELLFSGSTSGDVIVWNLDQGATAREIKDTACFPGHSRTIHKIAMNPFKSYELATASQDGTIKLFDLRDKDKASISFKTLMQKTAAASPVRDIAYYPRGDEFLAAGQENGIVSLWDRRNTSKALFSYAGHSCSINSIDWHPEGIQDNKYWLATSGSRDFLIKVWDLDPGHMPPSAGFTSARQSIVAPSARLAHVIRTIRVNRIKWRPGSASLNQIASTSSTSLDLSLHVWDVNRPFVPFAIFEGHKDVIQAIAWDPHNSNILYTVAKDQLVFRHQFPDNAFYLYDEMPMATVSVSPQGSLVHSIVQLPTQEEFLHLEMALQGQQSGPSDITDTKFPPEVEVGNKASRNSSTSSYNSLVKDNRLPYFLAFKSSVAHLLQYLPSTRDMIRDLLPNEVVSLATNYWFMGSSSLEVCAHNAELCRQNNRPSLENFWKFIMFALPWSQIAKETQKQMYESPGKFPKEEDFNYLPAICSIPVENLKLTSPLHNRPKKLLGKDNLKLASRKVSTQDRNKGVNLFMIEKLISTPVEDQNPALPALEDATSAAKGSSPEGPAVTQIEASDYLFTGTLRQVPTSTPTIPDRNSSNTLLSLGHNDSSLGTLELTTPTKLTSFGMDWSRPGCLTTLLGSVAIQDETPLSPTSALPALLKVPKIKEKINLQGKIDSSATVESERRDKGTQSYFKQRSTESKGSRKFIGKRLGKRTTVNQKPDSNCEELIQHPLAPLHKASLENVFPPFLMVDTRKMEEEPDIISASFFQKSLQLDSEDQEQSDLQPWDPIIDLNKWMMQLIDQGELSTVCTALLILGPERLNLWEHFSEAQVNSWFMAYIDLLSRFQLWITSSRVIKFLGLSAGLMDLSNNGALRQSLEVEKGVFFSSEDRRFSQGDSYAYEYSTLAADVARLNQNGTTFTIKCTACNKLVQPVLSRDCGGHEHASTNPSSPLDMVSAAGWACNRHSDRPASLSLCVLCHSTVRGLYIVCQLCNHGGHLHHIQQWRISGRVECPAGCGHICEYGA